MKVGIVVQRYGRRHQRRRRAACPIHCGTVVVACRRACLHDVCPGLRYVAERVSVRESNTSTEFRSNGFLSCESAMRATSAFGQQRVFGRAHTLQEEFEWLRARGPSALALVTRVRQSALSSTSSCFSASVTIKPISGAHRTRTRCTRSDRRARTRARCRDLSADLSRRPRNHVQLLRGTRRHQRRLRER